MNARLMDHCRWMAGERRLDGAGRLALVCTLALAIGGCAAPGVEEPTWASCFKAPSQTSMAEDLYCTQRTLPE